MEHNVLDIEKTKNLLYNVYLYFAADSLELDGILRYDLPIYRRISRFCVINEYLVNQFALEFLKENRVFNRGEKMGGWKDGNKACVDG